MKTGKCALFLGLILALTSLLQAESFSVLSLGDRKDATRWQTGVRDNLKLTEGKVIKSPAPTLADLKEFFGRSDHWIYIAGHYTHDDGLYNDRETISIKFEKDRVIIKHPDNANLILKKGAGFNQQSAQVVMWGGCSTHSSDDFVKAQRELFGSSAVFVGWMGTTGWEIVDINLGGKKLDGTSPAKNFFTYMNGSHDKTKVRAAWLQSADDINWVRDRDGNPVRPKFSVIDEQGQQYLLKEELTQGAGQKKGKKY